MKMDKYNIDFPDATKEQDLKRLINQLWKLIPMRENRENWAGHLQTVTEEVAGLVKLYKDQVDGLVLVSKLEGLTSSTCSDFMIYRRTVFKCIDLLARVLGHDTNESK